ncbi:MAG TPA: SRPBCC family protein [Nocardioidaceae bacterium]|jgi:uncharacterized protein YndB with AHSA1/START domain|nr:SRPBCC family protein [Nocardioidaceae bacterium]
MTSATRHETRIDAVPNQPILRITRDFDAPVERVFQAHVDPELLTRWLGPRNLVMRVDRFEPVTGGAYRYTHTGPDGEEHAFFGSFHEVRAPGRIVQTFTYEGFPDGVSLDLLELEDLGDGRTRLHATSVVDSVEVRDMIIASGMESGVVQGYEKLDELLAA